jgi:hypothetical protein
MGDSKMGDSKMGDNEMGDEEQWRQQKIIGAHQKRYHSRFANLPQLNRESTIPKQKLGALLRTPSFQLSDPCLHLLINRCRASRGT